MNQFNQNIFVTFWESTTIVNKLFILLSIVFWIIELFIGNQLRFQPISLQYVCIWQLITSGLVQGNIIQLILNLLCLPHLNSTERRLGSILYLLEYIIKNSLGMTLVFALSRLYCLIDYDENVLNASHFGFWNMTIYFMTQKTLKLPNEEIQVLVLPIVLKSQYYLIALLFILQFFSSSRYTVLVFAFLAFIEHLIYKGSLFRLPKKIIESIERQKLIQRFISRQDFIPIDQAQDLVFSGTQKIEFQVENFHKDLELSPSGGANSSQEKVPTEDDSMQIKQ